MASGFFAKFCKDFSMEMKGGSGGGDDGDDDDDDDD